MRCDAVEEYEQIVNVRDEIAQDDVVERLSVEVDFFAGRNKKSSSGCDSRASCTIRSLTSIPTPCVGRSAARRSPEPLPISSTDAPGRTKKRMIRATRAWYVRLRLRQRRSTGANVSKNAARAQILIYGLDDILRDRLFLCPRHPD